MSFRLFIGALLALSCCASTWAQVYQWRDADGKLHFSDTPPPESQKVEERRLQVNSMEGLKPVEPSPEAGGQTPSEASSAKELNPGQLQQKAQSQCAAMARRMPGLIEELDVAGREAIKDGRGTDADHKKMMTMMETMHRDLKRDPGKCATDYAKDNAAQKVVDCIADTKDAISFAFCGYFPG
jgi:hypothetical protein